MKVISDCHPSQTGRWFLSSRLGLALISFFVLMSMTSQRASMYVAIPCMVNQSALDAEMGIIVVNGSKIRPTPPPASEKFTSQKALLTKKRCNSSVTVLSPEINLAPVKDGEFVWTEDQQTVIYRTFYWGYLVAQVPAGWFASRFGSRKILAGFLMVGSLSTVMVPLSTSVHYFILLVVRFIGGIGAGAVFPSVIALWAKWAPPGERTRLLTISFSGSTLGLVLSYPFAGFLCRYGFDGGWRSIFYIFGGLGCIASVIWFMFVSDSPITHPRISKEEKIYIVTSLSGETDLQPNKEFHVPWGNFLTSMPFLSLAVCHFTCEWALYTFVTKVPLFMKAIVKIDVQKDPVVWLLPYIGLWLVVLVCGVWADKLRTQAVKTSIVRKLMQSIGTLVPAAFLLTLGFLDCEYIPAAIGIDILGIAFIGFQYSGFLVNHLDIYPKFAGVAIALCNSIGAASELVAPRLIEVVMKTKEQHEWQMIFIITAAFLAFGALCFALCGTGDLQSWASCQKYDLEDLNSCEGNSTSDCHGNEIVSNSSGSSDDIISGEKTIFQKQIEYFPDVNDIRRVPAEEKTPSKNLPRNNETVEENQLYFLDDDSRSPMSLALYNSMANSLSHYDTFPARGRYSPANVEKQGFQTSFSVNSLECPGLTRSHQRIPSPNTSVPHSIEYEEDCDSVFPRSRLTSPAFGSYSSLQQYKSLSQRPSRTSSISGQASPRTSLSGIDAPLRRQSLTLSSFPQPEPVGSPVAFEKLEESVV